MDLGLVYEVRLNSGNAHVTMTLTTLGCPMHEIIAEGARRALLDLDFVNNAEVEVVWDPPWHPSMMSEEGRAVTGVEQF